MWKYPHVLAQFRSLASHQGLLSEFLRQSSDPFDKAIGGIDIVGGDLYLVLFRPVLPPSWLSTSTARLSSNSLSYKWSPRQLAHGGGLPPIIAAEKVQNVKRAPTVGATLLL